MSRDKDMFYNVMGKLRLHASETDRHAQYKCSVDRPLLEQTVRRLGYYAVSNFWYIALRYVAQVTTNRFTS